MSENMGSNFQPIPNQFIPFHEKMQATPRNLIVEPEMNNRLVQENFNQTNKNTLISSEVSPKKNLLV